MLYYWDLMTTFLHSLAWRENFSFFPTRAPRRCFGMWANCRRKDQSSVVSGSKSSCLAWTSAKSTFFFLSPRKLLGVGWRDARAESLRQPCGFIISRKNCLSLFSLLGEEWGDGENELKIFLLSDCTSCSRKTSAGGSLFWVHSMEHHNRLSSGFSYLSERFSFRINRKKFLLKRQVEKLPKFQEIFN